MKIQACAEATRSKSQACSLPLGCQPQFFSLASFTMRRNSDLLIDSMAVLSAALLMDAWLRPRYSFRGKVVLITGGARGLGLVMARQLAREGARLIICSRTTEQV